MIKQNWVIGGDEKKRILNLHENATKNLYLIVEQNEVVFSIDFQNAFPSGQYNLTPQYVQIVNDNIEKIKNFIRGKNLKNFKLVISAGESQVPNPINPETNKQFEKGQLAYKRAEILKGYLEQSISAITGEKPIIEIANPIIGKTPWNGNLDNKDDPKFTAEQFVKVNVVISSPKEEPYRRTASLGEPIYLNKDSSNYLIGFIKEPFVKSTNVKDSGFINTEQNLIFTEVQKDTAPPVVLGQYEVPWKWWNSQRQLPTTKHITTSDLEKIRSFKQV